MIWTWREPRINDKCQVYFIYRTNRTSGDKLLMLICQVEVMLGWDPQRGRKLWAPACGKSTTVRHTEDVMQRWHHKRHALPGFSHLNSLNTPQLLEHVLFWLQILAAYMMKKYSWGLRKTMEFLSSRRPGGQHFYMIEIHMLFSYLHNFAYFICILCDVVRLCVRQWFPGSTQDSI